MLRQKRSNENRNDEWINRWRTPVLGIMLSATACLTYELTDRQLIRQTDYQNDDTEMVTHEQCVW